MTSTLFGSLGVHGGFLVWGLLGFHAAVSPSRVAPDAWLGGAVEVDTAQPEAAQSEAEQPEAAPTDTAQPEATHAENSSHAEQSESRPAIDLPKPKPQPAPRRAATVRGEPKQVGLASGTAASANADSSTQPGNDRPGGAFGSEGLPPGVGNLPSAFTRAITRAASLDPIWRTLPPGKAGDFTIAVEVDEPGHVASAEFRRPSPASAVPPELKRLRDRVVALLGGGQFALSSGGGAGSDRLQITITLSDGTPSENDNPEDVLELGFDPPRTGNVGRAHFRLGSGRRFEAIVVVLAAKR